MTRVPRAAKEISMPGRTRDSVSYLRAGLETVANSNHVGQHRGRQSATVDRSALETGIIRSAMEYVKGSSKSVRLNMPRLDRFRVR